MRTRGATVADIAILVVAADDGVQPQTIEAYNTIKEASLPFIVAINKIDKPGADPEKVKAQLAEKGVYMEGYGGTVPFAKISAKTGEGVPELLEVALILADMENLQADAKTKRQRHCHRIQHGFPKRNFFHPAHQKWDAQKRAVRSRRQSSCSGENSGKLLGRPIEEASFSSPVRVTGFSELPAVGDEFRTYADKNEAEEALAKRKEKTQTQTRIPNKTLSKATRWR